MVQEPYDTDDTDISHPANTFELRHTDRTVANMM